MTDKPAIKSTIYEYMLRSTSDGLILIDSDGYVSTVNPAGAGLLDITPENVIGKSPRDAFPLNPTLVNLCTRKGDQTLDVRLPRRRLAVGMATTLEAGDRIVLLDDVTERRNLDDRRESLVRAIAHDLKNPITAITGFADLIQKSGDLNDAQSRFVTRILQTSSKLQSVISMLVDLAWIEAGMPLQHRPIQLRDVINSAVRDISALAHDRNIVIAVSVQNPMPVVMGDPDRLRQVVYNLLHNAVIYSEPTQTVAIHGWGDPEEVYCSVADRGIGIADNELELVFDRMYRSRDERVRAIEGGGLGLTLARTIITRHGGDIWAASNLGEGATFTFLLPTLELST